MKSVLVSIIACLISMPSHAADPIETNSQIRDVTVFLSGAQITRLARVNLVKGTATLAFRDLPVNIDPQSIQARGEGSFVILSLLHQINYLSGGRKSIEVKSLQDTLKLLQDQLDLVNGMQSVMKGEEELLNANRDLGGNDKTVTVTELKGLADFYRTRLGEIKKEQINLNKRNTHLTREIEKVRNQLNIINAGENTPASEILVNISSREAASANIWIVYTVFDAGWSPVYDVRAKDIQSPVQLFYNARVFQHTGEAWEKVNLKLSTANPRQRGEKPNLQPWYIDFEQPVMYLNQYNAVPSISRQKMEAPMLSEDESVAADEAIESAGTAASLTEVTENQTNLEFVIRVPYDIPSDNKQYTINIQENVLPAAYEYYCAPKLDREAFLVARITGWEDLNLLSGEINLFFEGTYVGKSTLNVRNTNDTMDLSLGRDRGIVVTRVKMKDFTEQKTIGSNIRETRAWEITIRNNRKEALALRLEDQLPVTMNKDLLVESFDFSGGTYDKETGKVTWKLNMAPSEDKKLRLSFSLKYPKDKKVFID